MTDEPDPGGWERAIGVLRSVGLSDSDIEAAVEAGPEELTLVAARHLILPGSRQLTAPDVWELAGVEETTARSLWRAMGFPEPSDEETAFTETDVEALRMATQLFERARMSEAVMYQQARAMSQAAARIAESHQDVIGAILSQSQPADPESVALAVDALPALDHLLTYMYRRHLAAATEQRLLVRTEAGEGSIALSIGFADMTGFTEVSEAFSADELARTIDRFNATTADVIAQAGGRVVKMIGDEVMFTAPDPVRGAEVATSLLEVGPVDTGTPELRVGLATGQVLAREGDVFGSPVNLASRLVAIARPASVVVSRSVRDAVTHDDRLELSALPPKRLKGLGSVRAYRLRARPRG